MTTVKNLLDHKKHWYEPEDEPKNNSTEYYWQLIRNQSNNEL